MPSPAEVAAPGTRRRVEFIMGTAISLDLRDAGVPDEAVEAAFASLRADDARFSTYREDSELRRIQRGELALRHASDDLVEVRAHAERLARESEGAFDAWRHRADGTFDPTGLVKGWAVQRAADILCAAGARNFCLNGGGDVVVRGLRDGRPWRVGVRHPLEAQRVAVVLGLTDAAVATSAAYERGVHVLDPASGKAATKLLSATVVGPDLAVADGYATALFVDGLEGLRWLGRRPGFEAALITLDRRLVTTPGIDRLRVAA